MSFVCSSKAVIIHQCTVWVLFSSFFVQSKKNDADNFGTKRVKASSCRKHDFVQKILMNVHELCSSVILIEEQVPVWSLTYGNFSRGTECGVTVCKDTRDSVHAGCLNICRSAIKMNEFAT